MFNTLLKPRAAALPIGVDLDSKYLKMVQLAYKDGQVFLNCGVMEEVPGNIVYGSVEWQRWAIDTITKLHRDLEFKGKAVVTSISSQDVFVDHVKINQSEENFDEAISAMIKPRLPFPIENALIRNVPIESEGSTKKDIIVMATDKQKVNHLLAIYEKAGLHVNSLGIWPLTMANCYVKFFGRRKADAETIVMLLDISETYTNVAIVKNDNLLFARIIPTGFANLNDDNKVEQLMSEISACAKFFETSINGSSSVDKILFFSGAGANNEICEKVSNLAMELHIPALIGDVMGAVKIKDPENLHIERRDSKINWTMSFGLSLS